jgi:hypothetical protein
MPSDAPPAIDYSAQICLEALDWAIDFLARCGQTNKARPHFVHAEVDLFGTI